MRAREIEEDRRCRKCHRMWHVTAAGLKEHAASCDGVPEVTAARKREPRPPSRRIYPKVSNRERQRLAQRAILQMSEIKVLLLAILAQRGGEVAVTRGTIEQLKDDMDFEVVPGATPEEKIVRIVK